MTTSRRAFIGQLAGAAFALPGALRVDHVMNAPGLSDTDKVAILGGNLERLLGIPRSA